MQPLKNIRLHPAILLLSLALCPPLAWSQTPGTRFAEQFSRQERIYHDKVQEYVEGYVTDRTLTDYMSALPSGFDGALATLGPEDRWLDIGAGMGQAILDYYSPRYDLMHAEIRKAHARKARAVAMSIEDRRTVFWDQAAARLEPNQIQYLCNKRLREYSSAELGRFQIITDVVGGFSYTADLRVFMEQVLDLLEVNGSFYTVLQDVQPENGSNKPHYTGAPFLTEIKDASGSDVGVCSWLKQITCAEVTCEYKPDWQPPIETYRIRKVCNDVAVPTLETTHFEAGTPPERAFKITNTPPASAGQTTATR